jgi:hypothetical protein
MIKAGVEDLMRRIGDDQAELGCTVAGQSGGQVTPSVIRIVHVEETRSASFLFYTKNRSRWFVSGLASKLLRRFLGLGLKIIVTFFGLSLKTM